MSNLRQFTATLDRFRVKSAQAIPLIQRRLALEALKRVVVRTPVGDPDLWESDPPEGYVGGHARRNWQASINAPASGEVSGVDQSFEGASTRAEGATTIHAAPQFCQIWLSNNVPYIERLEVGHSTQAPSGMLRLTFGEIVAKYSSTADQVIRELGL